MSRRGAASLDVGVHRLCRLGVTQPLTELVARLNEFRPQHLNAYPSIAGRLADEQLAGRLQLGEGLRLRVALRDGADDAPARLKARVSERLEQLGVQRPAVEVETVDALERSPGGKLQMVVAGRT